MRFRLRNKLTSEIPGQSGHALPSSALHIRAGADIGWSGKLSYTWILQITETMQVEATMAKKLFKEITDRDPLAAWTPTTHPTMGM